MITTPLALYARFIIPSMFFIVSQNTGDM